MKLWMVRSGSGGRWADECVDKGIVGLGWLEAGDPNSFVDKRALQRAILAAYPDYSEGQAASAASQLWRFRTEVAEGDQVITYDSGSRFYHFGTIVGPPVHDASEVEELSYQRKVTWSDNPISRDGLSDDARNRLGSVLTLFLVPDRTANELRSMAAGKSIPQTSFELEEDQPLDPFATIVDEAALRIADRIAEFGWRDMQHLVGALLRAMGYKTEISADGPDRGRDIVASPDGFGFEQPRIVVEVKHRPGEKIDAPALRSFLGGRHKDDRGLYVSTGGFTKDAYYEADRSNIPLKLMTLDELSRAVIENYELFDSDGRALLPLKKLYWPA
jgi:restriction system protein